MKLLKIRESKVVQQRWFMCSCCEQKLCFEVVQKVMLWPPHTLSLHLAKIELVESYFAWSWDRESRDRNFSRLPQE